MPQFPIICIAGPKHSGKTCAGRAMQELADCVFYDADAVIQDMTGQSARALFLENSLQEAEFSAIKFTLDKYSASRYNEKTFVIALGGGFSDNERAVQLVKAQRNARIVCLKVSAETAWRRICAQGVLPPFLRTCDPVSTHRALHERRNRDCAKLAHIVISAEGKTSAEIAREIWKKSIPSAK